jgi:hypothetical protein
MKSANQVGMSVAFHEWDVLSNNDKQSNSLTMLQKSPIPILRKKET